jgi:quinol monooxygenase YgiN
MICHVVTFNFTSGTSPDWIEELSAALDQLGSQMAAQSYRHGRDLGHRQGNADYSVTAVFHDEAAFTAYLASPAHQRIVHDILAPHLESRSAVQFETAG